MNNLLLISFIILTQIAIAQNDNNIANDHIKKRDKPNLAEPETHITNIDLFYKNTNWPDIIESNENIADSILEPYQLPYNLVLPYYRNHLTFGFIAFGVKKSDKVQYQWKLEGFDKDWSPITQKTEATYSYIQPGEYNFLVKACNDEGVWNKEPITYSFTITPPFWQTWLFYLIWIFSILIVIIGYIKIRERKIKRKVREEAWLNQIDDKKKDEFLLSLKKRKKRANFIKILFFATLFFLSLIVFFLENQYLYLRFFQTSPSNIDKFIYLNKGLEAANYSHVMTSQNIRGKMHAAVEKSGNRAADVAILEAAKFVSVESNKLIRRMDMWKSELVDACGGEMPSGSGIPENKAEDEQVHHIMIGIAENGYTGDAKKAGRAYELKELLDSYLSFIKSIVDDPKVQEIPGLALSAEEDPIWKHDPDQSGKDFAHLAFENTPVVAALAVLSQKQAEVSSLEKVVMNYLAERLRRAKVK